jgi:ankyrin repeat protein
MSVPTNASDELTSLIKKYAALDMFAGYDIVAPDSPGPSGDTPFHMVAFDGDVAAARVMLPYISDIDLCGDLGNSPLHYAVMQGNVEIANFLLQHGANVRKANEYGDTPIDYMEGNDGFKAFLDAM